jgi:hypothetical protein
MIIRIEAKLSAKVADEEWDEALPPTPPFRSVPRGGFEPPSPDRE